MEHSGETERDSDLYRMRHSMSHILAQAVLDMRPGSTLGFGPPIKDGFYYDFILSAPITEEDFPELEKRIRKILKRGSRFDREELIYDDAMSRLDDMSEPYKREYAEELFVKHKLETLSFYRNGPFVDMCEGPHVENSKKIPRDAFKIRSVAGAYWRGNSDNVMMTRIYVWAFSNKEVLDEHVSNYFLALERDHKKLGRELGIYTIDNDIGKGLPLWLPNGCIIRDEIEKLAKELEFQAGYQRVSTPNLAKIDLYYQSGHLPYYADHMYPTMEVMEAGDQGDAIKETYVLRPMNCPHHHKVFSSEPRSYRELPIRLAEYGQVYRWEDSGAVGGLVRVRGMCMNDAHIYCTAEQVKDEFKAVMSLYDEAYRILGLKEYYVRFSRWDPEDPKGKEKYVNDPQAWNDSEQLLREVLEELEIEYTDAPGEAAFYGPKIDIQFPTVTGRDESVSTVQLDFAVPGRLGLKYIGSDGEEHTPYCIHRAPFSTHERMVAFLIEHFAGAFPTWLAPLQVQVLTVSEHFDDYGNALVAKLRKHFVRAELATSNETVPKKIRAGTTRKIPNLLIVGEREMKEGTVTLRRYGEREQHTMPYEAFEEALLKTITGRELQFSLPGES
ncbi:MAG: threonine--tRNA ligase [Pseudomonadales bacterium]|nr:threonine--tRNA ligase [Pseudomonadales bacterium]